jgi:hypothetical protein
LLVSPPRERPRLSRLGLPGDFLSFDPAPCVQADGREDLCVDIGRWLVSGASGVLMGADHPGVHRNRPLRAFLLVGVAAQLVQDTGPCTVS